MKFTRTLLLLTTISSISAMETTEYTKLAHSYQEAPFLINMIESQSTESSNELANRIQYEFNKDCGLKYKQKFREAVAEDYQKCVNTGATHIDMNTYNWIDLCERWEQKTRSDIEKFIYKLQKKLDQFAQQYKDHPSFEEMMLENKLSIEHNFYETLTIRN